MFLSHRVICKVSFLYVQLSINNFYSHFYGIKHLITGESLTAEIFCSILSPVKDIITFLTCSLLSFDKDGFGFKWPTKVDISLNKETKPNSLRKSWMGSVVIFINKDKTALFPLYKTKYECRFYIEFV